MGVSQNQAYCPRCDRYVLAARPEPMHLLHFLLACLSWGLWLPIWLLASLSCGPYRCQHCGLGVFTREARRIARDQARIETIRETIRDAQAWVDDLVLPPIVAPERLAPPKQHDREVDVLAAEWVRPEPQWARKLR